MRPGGISSSLGSQAGSRVARPHAILPSLVVTAMGQARLEAPGQMGKRCASRSPEQGGHNAAVRVPEDEAEQIPQASHGADSCCHARQVGDWQPLAAHPPPCRHPPSSASQAMLTQAWRRPDTVHHLTCTARPQ